MPVNNTIVIYHANCPDGFGSAYATWKKFGDQAEYYAGVHQTPPPDVRNKDVVLVDFSYKCDVMQQLSEQANSVLVLDHHKSAYEDLQPLRQNQSINSVFDMERCGCMITWQYYHQQAAPKLFEYIQDRDLWQFKLPGTMEIFMVLQTYPQTFKTWQQLIDDIEHDLDRIIADGAAMLRWYHAKLSELKQYVIRGKIAGYEIPIVNAPLMFASDLAGELAENEPFAAIYHDLPTGRSFSLRSRNNGIDVANIAMLFGGGGHRNAAGFKFSPQQADLIELP